jgi:hypothetical protein
MKSKRKKRVVSSYTFDMKHNTMNITTKTKINREVMGSCGLNLQCNVTNITTKAKRDRLWAQVGSTCNKKKPWA